MCMRTTLTLCDDVAVQIERLRHERKASLKDVINGALREGLRQMTVPRRRRPANVTASVRLGRCLIGSLDDVSEALAIAEGEKFR